MSDSSSVVSLEIILFSITTFSCISFGILYCCKYCWRRMRACSLLSMNTTVMIAQYMIIRKTQKSFGIFQKSADSLLSDEIKIGKRIAKTIKIAMVNLNKTTWSLPVLTRSFVFVVFTTASPAGADGGSGYPCASGSGYRVHVPGETEIGCCIVPPQGSYPACRSVGQAHRDLSVFSLKTACVCSACRRPVPVVVRDVAVASKTPSGTGKKSSCTVITAGTGCEKNGTSEW